MALRFLIADNIVNTLKHSICHMATHPDPVVIELITKAMDAEQDELAKDILSTILENAHQARITGIPLCQDTGTLVAFVEMGREVIIPEQTIENVINQALEEATRECGMRASILADPLYNRINTFSNSPAIIHLRQVEGEDLNIRLALKGGGAENMSRLAMLTPAHAEQDIIDYIVDTVIAAGGRPCPPLIIGVGIGGNFETCALLAKEALLEPLDKPHPHSSYAALEQKILQAVNATNVGPQGMGGMNTALAVKIKVAPCHIASLPVAVNLQCHAHRHMEITF